MRTIKERNLNGPFLQNCVPVLCALCLVLSSACDRVLNVVFEPRPDVAAAKRFHKSGVAFAYPGNWTVAEDKSERIEAIKVRTLQVESKGNGLAMIQVFEPAIAIDLGNYAKDVLDGMAAELSKGWKKVIRRGAPRHVDLEDKFLGEKRRCRRIRWPLELAGESVPTIVDVRAAMRAKCTVVLVTIIAESHRDRVQPAFDQIRNSLKVRPDV